MSTRGRRRAAGVVLALVAAGVGVAVWRVRAAVPSGGTVAVAPEAAPNTPDAAVPAAAPPPGHVVVPYVKPPSVKAVPAIGQQAAAEYRRRARYPRSAQPLLTEEPDPIVRDREISAVESRGPNGAEPTLRVFPAAMSFEAPEPAVVFAELSVRGAPVAAREIRGTLTTESLEPLGEVLFRDDGQGGDAAPGDGRHTAVVPGDALGTRLATSYLVQVVAHLGNDGERRGAASFMYAAPHGHLTGNYRDAVVDGSLVVGVEVAVAEAGRFHVEATLYGPDGVEKIAWAQAAQWLEPGAHWLDLSYYGLILRERGLDGPYVLRYVALSTTSEMPNAKNRVVEWPYRTGAHPVTAFTDRPFDDPDLLEAARRLEDDPMPAGLEAGS